MEERTGVFAAGDNQLTLLGPEISVGQQGAQFHSFRRGSETR